MIKSVTYTFHTERDKKMVELGIVTEYYFLFHCIYINLYKLLHTPSRLAFRLISVL
jgi:hypothetical protein